MVQAIVVHVLSVPSLLLGNRDPRPCTAQSQTAFISPRSSEHNDTQSGREIVYSDPRVTTLISGGVRESLGRVMSALPFLSPSPPNDACHQAKRLFFSSPLLFLSISCWVFHPRGLIYLPSRRFRSRQLERPTPSSST